MEESEWERQREREKFKTKPTQKKRILMSIRRVVINGKCCSICTHTYFALCSQSRVNIWSGEITNWAYVIGSLPSCIASPRSMDWIGLQQEHKNNELKWGKDKRFFSNSLIRNVCRSFYFLLFRLRVEMKSIKAAMACCCCFLRRCNTVENKRKYSTFRNSLCLGNCIFMYTWNARIGQ